jgi:hypothetical protein
MFKYFMLIMIFFSGLIFAEDQKRCFCTSDKHEIVTIAILAKDKAHTLPLYLKCIENQTWPKDHTCIYIRTNNNRDNTVQILKEWVEKVKNDYLQIYFDDSDVKEQVQKYGQHEWNSIRFKVLGKIRQDSVEWAKKNNSHYFVIDCDNFIKRHTIEAMYKTQAPVIAPFLRTGHNYYSNYHADIDKNGYLKECPLYYEIYNQVKKGLIQVPVVHCTYFIRNEYLDAVCYDDESYRYEYVIFSDLLRKKGIPQVIDNRELYGRVTMSETPSELAKESFIMEVSNY